MTYTTAIHLSLRDCLKIPRGVGVWLVAGAMLLAGFDACATTYYVTPRGFDKNAGTTWATAKLTIQAAIDAATNNDLVLVTNGIYATGGITNGYLTNRITLNKPLMVKSVNGPQFTLIQGTQVPGSTLGASAVRCAYVGPGATLSGFTLTNGATRSFDGTPGETAYDQSGGGVWCDGTIENCLITGNAGLGAGGALVTGACDNCIFSNNVALNFYYAGFGYLVGVGGVSGVSSGGTLNNCLVINNQGNKAGACSDQCYLNNCTITGNASTNPAVVNCALANCIVYYNTNFNNPYDPSTRQIDTTSTATYTCTRLLPPGTGNFTNAPIFVSPTNFRLGPYSPCADAGNNNVLPGFTDLDGQPRFFRTIDLGCYERQIPGDLNNDGVVDINDLNVVLKNYSSTVDQAAVSAVLSNYWPNNLLLNMTNLAGLGTTNVTFALSNSNAGAYSVQYSTDLKIWQTLGPAIPGYTFTDTNAVAGQQRYYRLSFP